MVKVLEDKVVWRETMPGVLKAFLQTPAGREREITWCPQPGSQEAFLASPVFETLFEGTRGPGKGLPLDEPVWTPCGPRPIKDLSVGSPVCCPDGSVSKVIGVYPQGKRPVYEITFDDGAVSRCDDQHIWDVKLEPNVDRVLAKMSCVLDLFARGYKIDIPTLDALNITETSHLYIDPYVLGLSVGCGDAGLSRIPQRYLMSPTDVRLDVLHGLMDANGDGFVFNGVYDQVVEDVQFLVRSLGGKATKNKTDVFIQTGGKFALYRKNNVGCEKSDENLYRRIVDIKQLEDQETVCIKIDHPNGLFITRDFVVTHNTDGLLMDFAQHVGQGFGMEWRGILFRQTYPQLSDVINKSLKWFPQIFPTARYNKVDKAWTFEGGEQMMFRHMRVKEDYQNYHGHAYPWLGFEELTTWTTLEPYQLMMSCCRSTVPGIPRKFRSTTNPYGPAHNLVKARFRLPAWRYKIIKDSYRDGELEPERVAIFGKLAENRILLCSDPDYIRKVRASARNKAELAAWIDGSWDVTSGGMFDDIWDSTQNVVPTFPVNLIPKSWKIDRGFDWGSKKPFAALWFAESSGEPLKFNGKLYGTIRGDVFIIREWYGFTGERNVGVGMTANAVGRGVLDREDDWGIMAKPGPADSAIYTDLGTGKSIADEMKPCQWTPVDKSPGSRVNGWEIVRGYLKSAQQQKGYVRERPGLFVCDCCVQTLITVPSLKRDERNVDDVDTDSEDHIADVIRYRLFVKGLGGVNRRTMR